MWADNDVAEALHHSSPALATQVRALCTAERPALRDVQRTALSVARYLLRAQHRATPFGLFAGVATAEFGPQVRANWGEEHVAVGRAGAEWTHIEAHRGVGKRMLDGRQVAVLAALVEGDTARAAVLLADTMPGDPWEQAVTACLTGLCRRDAGQTGDGHLADLAAAYLERRSEPGMTVFDARLGLTVLDPIGSADSPAAHRIVEDLHRRTTEAEDGYAARENLAHPLFTEIATDRQVQDCRALVRSCALGTGTMSDELKGELTAALRASDSVIRESLAWPSNLGRACPME
ncbi:lantibiotic dehydratase [Streptomyces sp. NBC_00582]|uniref:lantibiotic dehydratase n=1 Tax=Streptomyces sp. NBC_00582 TaxID=2975783 RepID=UPI003FCD4A76